MQQEGTRLAHSKDPNVLRPVCVVYNVKYGSWEDKQFHMIVFSCPQSQGETLRNITRRGLCEEQDAYRYILKMALKIIKQQL